MELKLKHVFIANIFTTVIFGLGFIFMTETMVASFGITGNVIGFQFFGSFMVCHGILVFFARNSEDTPARKAILLFETIGGFVLTLDMLFLLSLASFSTWASIVLQLILVGLYGYFLFKKE